jgi:hypothetical protein
MPKRFIGSLPGAPARETRADTSRWSLRALSRETEETLWFWQQCTADGTLVAQSPHGFAEYADCLSDAIRNGYLGLQKG